MKKPRTILLKKPRTKSPSQIRNAKVLQLRGLYANAIRLLTNIPELKTVLIAVDHELEVVDAEPETFRRKVIHQALTEGKTTTIEYGKIKIV